MLIFLQSNVPLVFGALLALGLIAVRAASTDTTFRSDLRGAIAFLFAFLALRTGWWLFKDLVPEAAGKALLVGWMLSFAFGCIRTVVSLALRLLRFTARAPPKILRDVIDFALYAMAAVPILKAQLDIDLTGLLATSAIVSVVIGLALQDTLGNLFAGLSIQLERPFQVGDYVTIKDHTGRVAQIAWRATRLETFRREWVTLPNNILSKEAIRNHSRGKDPVAIDLFVSASYEAPPNRVKAAVRDALRDIPFVLEEPAPSCLACQYDEAGVRYRVRAFIRDYVHSDAVVDEIHTRLWYRFGREGIALPVPRRDLLLRTQAAPERRSPEAQAKLLGSIDLFAMLGRDELEALAAQLVERRFGRGEPVIEQGQEGHTFYVVAEGEVSVRAGQPATEIARLSPGSYFGEMSLLTGEPRSATVAATQDSVLLELDRPAFARLFEAHPGLAKQFSALLAQRRQELRAAAQVTAAADAAPEAGRIFTRLRQILRLTHE